MVLRLNFLKIPRPIQTILIATILIATDINGETELIALIGEMIPLIKLMVVEMLMLIIIIYTIWFVIYYPYGSTDVSVQ